MQRVLIAVLALLLPTGASAQRIRRSTLEPASGRVEERRAAEPDGLVEIENMVGSITVAGWDRREVTVTGTLGPGADGLEVSGDPHRTRIGIQSIGNPHGVRADLEVHIPATSRVVIESFNATITVSEVTGPLRAETVNGSISVTGGSKEVDAQAVGGSVTIVGTTTHVHAESVNGSVTVRGASGDIEATTVNGRLQVVGGVFQRGHLETVSGSVHFEGDIAPKGSLSAESVSGSVELALSANVAADFSLSTFSGHIDNEFGAEGHSQPQPEGRTGELKRHYSPQKDLHFSTGSGGAKVSVSTLSGSIALRKR